ncbi:DUF6506 family protein [Pseudogulbenkiania ferrooxidans]|uniref:Uncharacterized protein n=1 Tax=Pseudogulbenkiania ferrooxidans EGD-HP2 TaxID=1388764 RepID=A0ABP2XN54_9NEIS|nr:DUF6506 family protein [Pseudogulbenkiania ferrooxidans]ERE10643.1 hypothetical protein O166_23905 [Pseudogulbenkiania ferrooxidans EGD-HP2]
MALKAAFIFIAPHGDPQRHRAITATPEVEVITIAVSSYREAGEAARELAEQGCAAIELCGGFGHQGVAIVAAAVGELAAVGAVRFDPHPLLGHRSGDKLA